MSDFKLGDRHMSIGARFGPTWQIGARDEVVRELEHQGLHGFAAWAAKTEPSTPGVYEVRVPKPKSSAVEEYLWRLARVDTYEDYQAMCLEIMRDGVRLPTLRPPRVIVTEEDALTAAIEATSARVVQLNRLKPYPWP